MGRRANGQPLWNSEHILQSKHRFRARLRYFIPIVLPQPDISRYAEYQKFLQDAYVARKSHDARFSQRFINQRMGAKSSGWFADILAKRQKLKSRHAAPLSAVFKLEAKERDFLKVLIELELASTPEERTAAYDTWFQLKGMRQEKITRDKFKYFDRWYYPALRELLTLQPFDGNHAALAAKFNPPLTSRQAREAMETLTRLGVVLPGSPTPLPVLVKDSSSKTNHWHQILKSYMGLAVPALQRFSKEERDFSSLTLTFSSEGLKKAGEEIAALRSRLLMLSEKDREKNRVYQCLFQVFPLTEPLEISRD